jgi:CO dehydrogenase/acetyl-CoA synthase beta subunit
MQADVGMELGHPRDHSASLTLWTEDLHSVSDNTVTLFGPDIQDAERKGLPFGKVVLLGVEGFDEECAFYRQKELELTVCDVSLKGYMLRATTELTREWSRISKEALRSGFSLSTLAQGLMREYKKKEYVKRVEILFVTSCSEDVEALRPLAERAKKITRALSKFEAEVSHDCGSCDLDDVCSDVVALREMRRKADSREATSDA